MKRWVALVIVVLAGYSASAAVAADRLPSGRTEFRTLADYERDMDVLAARRPDLVRPLTLPHRSFEGRAVRGLEITRDARARDGKPVLLIVGMHHGNEWPSGEVTMEFGFDLVQGFGRDPRITRLLDRARVILVPVVNVDGFVRNTRRTANDVDMNRNFGFGWGESPPYQGAFPFSEPETQNMRELVSSRQIPALLTMHTCLANMLYPPLQNKAGQTPDLARFVSLADAMSAQNGYPHLTSADDYETTGETIDWAYYATRGLAITIEVCATPAGETRTFQTLVTEEYLGTGALAGKGNRGAFLAALEHTTNRAEHAVITGKARRGAVLTISKDFPLWTNPVAQQGGAPRPLAFDNHLESSMVVTSPSGKFSWDVNPSLRPVPPYQADGVHADHAGFVAESWTLTCARPDGRVLETVRVQVDLGGEAAVALKQCRKRLR